MKTSERVWRIGRDVAGVLPRAHAALRSEGWNPRSPSGVRLLGEVLMDEAALTGMTLTAPPPKLERHEEACAAAAAELSELGVGAHADPEPLYPRAIRRQRFERLVYERLTFDHDPLLPRSLAVEGFGGMQPQRYTCGGGAMTGDRGWYGCTAQVRDSRWISCSRGPGASRASSVSTLRCRCSRATVSVAKHGRLIRIWIRWPTSLG